MGPILDAGMPGQVIWPAQADCGGTRVDPDILLKIGSSAQPAPTTVCSTGPRMTK